MVSAILTTHPSNVMGRRSIEGFLLFRLISSSSILKSLSFWGSNAWECNSPSWQRIPSKTWEVRFHPFPFLSISCRNLTLCILWRKWPMPCDSEREERYFSPSWPKGVWPMSCPRAMASIKSSLSLRRRPMVLPILDTSCTCKTRWVMWSFFIR